MEEVLVAAEVDRLLRAADRELTPRERRVLDARYGLGGQDPGRSARSGRNSASPRSGWPSWRNAPWTNSGPHWEPGNGLFKTGSGRVTLVGRQRNDDWSTKGGET
jgi:hypothetical protein